MGNQIFYGVGLCSLTLGLQELCYYTCLYYTLKLKEKKIMIGNNYYLTRYL